MNSKSVQSPWNVTVDNTALNDVLEKKYFWLCFLLIDTDVIIVSREMKVPESSCEQWEPLPSQML